jgi:hypothetical protein
MGRARRARSNACRVTVTKGCWSRNLRYISHIRGILFSSIRALSNRALTLRYSDAKIAALSFVRCFVRNRKYWAISVCPMHCRKLESQRQRGFTHHFPQLVRARELSTCSFEDKRLLVDRSMLELEVDISKPWFRATGISEDILFIDGVLVGLQSLVSTIE